MNNPVDDLTKVHVNSKKVSCDGGDNKSKHPLVYLDMGKNDFISCPYCGKYFTTKPSFLNNKK